ncbi:hypothetical protein [Actinoplanes sp. NPDC051859]|uniref:hypothetical protein n=1 Tax=Actinoplanes sp. NPDC051859 TaxID=3363909 RepID=UPI00378F1205
MSLSGSLDPFAVADTEDGHLRDGARALIQLLLELPYTNRPDQSVRERVYGSRVVGLRVPRGVGGGYEWATGPAGRLVLRQVLDYLRAGGSPVLSPGDLSALVGPLDFSAQTCHRQLHRLMATTAEIRALTGAVISRRPVGTFSDEGIQLADWVAEAARALPALPSVAAVRDVAMTSRLQWPLRSNAPPSPVPIDLMHWVALVAPQVRATVTVPLTDVQQHIGTETTSKHASVRFLDRSIEGWIPAIDDQFPGLGVRLTESALTLTPTDRSEDGFGVGTELASDAEDPAAAPRTRRCDIAVYGIDSVLDQRFSRLGAISNHGPTRTRQEVIPR